MKTFAIANAAILVAISLFHFYWALGGKWRVGAVFPEIKGMKKGIKPRALETIVVAILFFMMAMLYLEKVQILSVPLPQWISDYGIWILAIIFFIRAIGEFKYIGFFKSEKDSKFAQLDTKFYSPLCVLLSLNSLLIAWYIR